MRSRRSCMCITHPSQGAGSTLPFLLRCTKSAVSLLSRQWLCDIHGHVNCHAAEGLYRIEQVVICREQIPSIHHQLVVPSEHPQAAYCCPIAACCLWLLHACMGACMGARLRRPGGYTILSQIGSHQYQNGSTVVTMAIVLLANFIMCSTPFQSLQLPTPSSICITQCRP